MLSPTERFSNRVDQYVRARPKYPAALLRFFQSELGLSPAHTVADIGSGTGFLTELFVRNGNSIYAVEPNAPMRNAAEAYLKEWSNFHSIDATAEATTLEAASIDFVTVAQAFHWFNVELARKEFRRILKPTGIAALIWNERLIRASPFMVEYEKVIQKYRRQEEPVRPRLLDADESGDIRQFFGSGDFKFQRFDNPQMLDLAGFHDRIASSSYMPVPGEAGSAEMIKDTEVLFNAHQQSQSVRILHETHVYYGSLNA